MKLLILLFFSLSLTPLNWLGNIQTATSQAQSGHKCILINFSGSDWCGPCIRLRKEILESAVFEEYAVPNLVLLRADFPRQKKNQLTSVQQGLNESLAERYNPEGKFPFTLLVDSNGKVLKSWDGYIDQLPEKFVSDIKQLADAAH